ncbi:hypothetical protein KKD03_04720 [Patescibacteria group bacterium]|nr:hypothetical protein [Patescibacteria group bacterium]
MNEISSTAKKKKNLNGSYSVVEGFCGEKFVYVVVESKEKQKKKKQK